MQNKHSLPDDSTRSDEQFEESADIALLRQLAESSARALEKKRRDLSDLEGELQDDEDEIDALKVKLDAKIEFREAVASSPPKPKQTQQSWFPFSSQPKRVIADSETMTTIIDLGKEIKALELDISEKEKELSQKKERATSLEEEIKEAEKQATKDQEDLQQAMNPTMLGQMRKGFNDRKARAELSSLSFEEEEEDISTLSDEDDVRPMSASEATVDQFDGVESVESGNSSTVVDPYEEQKSRTSSMATEEIYISSALDRSNKVNQERVVEIEQDQAEFSKLISKITQVVDDLVEREEMLESQNKTIHYLSAAFNEYPTFDDVTNVSRVEKMVEEYASLPKSIVILGQQPEPLIHRQVANIDDLGPEELSATFHDLKEDAECRKHRFRIAQELYDLKKPTTTIGIFLYAINRFVTHLFGGTTALEKAEIRLKKRKEEFTDVVSSMRLVVASSLVYKKDVLAGKLDNVENIEHLNADKKNLNTKLNALMTKYRIPKNENLSMQEDKAMDIFDKAILKAKKETVTFDEEKIKNELARRSYVYFVYTDASRVKLELKKFLENPTELNLNSLKESMNKYPNYIRDPSLLMLIKDAQVLYPDIPRIPLVEMDMVKINTHFDDKVVMLAEKISLLETECDDIQADLRQENSALLEAREAVQTNLLALEQCKNLLLLTRQREKDYRETRDPQEKMLLAEAVKLATYLESRIADILTEIPTQAKGRADEIMQRDRKVFSLNYDLCREDIKNIFSKYRIRVPTESITLSKIKSLYAHLEPDVQEKILSEINALEAIEMQVPSLLQEVSEEEMSVFKSILASREQYDAVLDAMSRCDLVDDDHWEMFSTLFENFEREYSRNPGPALEAFESSLVKYKDAYPGVFDDLLEKIENHRTFSYPKGVGQIFRPAVAIQSDLAAIETEDKRVLSGLERVEQLNLEIRQLNLEKEQIKQVRDSCIQHQLPPPEVPKEIKAIISECNAKFNLSYATDFSGVRTKLRTALSNFLSVPTTARLKELQQVMRANPEWEKDEKFKVLIEKASEYYPQITKKPAPTFAPEQNNAATQQAYKSQLQGMKASQDTAAKPESELRNTSINLPSGS